MAVIAVVASIVVTFGIGAAAGHGTASPWATPAAAITAVRMVTAAPPTAGVGATQPTSTGGSQPPSGPSSGGPTNLSAIKPVQTAGSIGNFTTGSVQIGTTTYPNSVRFTCGYVVSGPGNVVYNVAGFTFLDAMIGVPNDATNGIGDTMAITFFKDGSTQLGSPLNIVLGQSQTVHLDLQGASQLELKCLPTDNVSHNEVQMDIALGDATISPA
ncbi:MAG: NPCBM/NEW2 domain-containing protein [Pseudonocardiales bacterium]|nr:NPCBM/NEW2 domain-containing protein [Pseudonocardiales bacterium]